MGSSRKGGSEGNSEANFRPLWENAKYCPDCHETKPFTEFHRDRRRKDGLAFYCKPCARDRWHRSRERRRELGDLPPKRLRTPRWSEVPEGFKICPECGETKALAEFAVNTSRTSGIGLYCLPCHQAIVVRNVEKNHGSTRNYHLKRRYGIGEEEVAALIEAQGGTCAVCKGPAQHVDHDHGTGKVRGVLCFNCNQALGNVRDSVEVLDGLADYLEEHSCDTTTTSIVERRLRLILSGSPPSPSGSRSPAPTSSPDGERSTEAS